jgi:hypothetical protein
MPQRGMFWLIYFLVRFRFRWLCASSPCLSAALNFLLWMLHVLTAIFNISLLGSISADTALQAHAATRHWASVPGRQLGVLSLMVLPQRLRSQVCDYGICKKNPLFCYHECFRSLWSWINIQCRPLIRIQELNLVSRPGSEPAFTVPNLGRALLSLNLPRDRGGGLWVL